MNEAELRQALIVKELEKIKTELNNKSFAYSLTDNFENDIVIGVIKVSDIEKILDNHISELKGEQKVEKVDCDKTDCSNCINRNYCDYEYTN